MPEVVKERDRPGRRVQLHRAVAKLGWGSRRQAWDWIRAGQVLVDGRAITDPLTWVDLDRQRLTRDGQDAEPKALVTLALHKPRGIVTTRSDERGRRTVYDLLPSDLPWIFPAGRLDADSEGLLILTNDAALAVRLTDPAHHVPKTYHITLRGQLDEAALQRLRDGVELGDRPTRPTEVRVLRRRATTTQVEMVLTEGRNRQIRRMAQEVGLKVKRLIRVAIGSYTLELPVGACRPLGKDEIGKLIS
jgi:23S rRNA pseudouridine2605 synthase